MEGGDGGDGGGGGVQVTYLQSPPVMSVIPLAILDLKVKVDVLSSINIVV